jgi:enoyl-CoA hydratase/carnithine racemase
MTGELFDAATLERWNVVNRVLPDDGFHAVARSFALGLAQGPTLAHNVTKQIVRAYLDGGVLRADYAVPKLSGDLFATEDLRSAVRSFIDRGPGKATFDGR